MTHYDPTQSAIREALRKVAFEPTDCFVSIRHAICFFKTSRSKDQVFAAIAEGSVRIGMPPKKPGHRSIFDLNLGKGQWMVKYIPETLSNP